MNSSRGSTAQPSAQSTPTPVSRKPDEKSEKTDRVERSERARVGLGILSIDPAAARSRSYTIDSLNISPIENSVHARSFETPASTEPSANWEKATWEFSDILQSLSGKDRTDLAGIVRKCNQLVPLLRNHPSLKNEIVIENVVFKVQFMLYDPRSQVRSAAYRLLRHSSASAESLLHLVHSKILIFLIVSLSTETPMLEKEQALKLVREFVNVPGGVNYLSVGIVKALVAHIEHEHDENANGEGLAGGPETHSFTRMCIETVSEIAVLNPDIVFHGGGLRLLINLTINGSADISVFCLPTLLTLLDMPHSRLFLRNGADLDGLMSVYTLFEDDDDIKSSYTKRYSQKAMKMSFILSCLMKTWSGLICFSHDNFAPVRMLLLNLRKRNKKLCAILLDLLLDILRIQNLPWLEDSAIGDILAQVHNQYKRGESSGSLSFSYAEIDPKSFEYGVISHYQGLLCKVLINCGLVPLLFQIVNENRDAQNTDKATCLLTNLLDLCSKHLPSEFYSTHILRAYSTDLSLSSLSKIEAATRTRQHTANAAKNAEVKVIVRDFTQKLRVDMPDNTFKSLVSGTKVLTVKDFDEWNWSLLSQLFQGPLRNSARFSELQEKYPKFLKTILSFLRPFKYRFSSVPITASSKYPKIRRPKNIILVACSLIEGLLSTEEGSRFLGSNKLMPQISEIFAQIDPFSGVDSKDPILAKRRLEHSLSIGYVKIVGIMSASARGREILEQWQLFHMMSNIIESSVTSDSNNYLIFNILQSLDYTGKGHARLILAKAMSISNWKIKIYALESVFPSLAVLEGCEKLYVLSLVNLLYDESEAVTKMSVDCLYEYFITNDNLEMIDILVECRPSVMVLERSEQGQFLLLNFCTTPRGFQYLEENGFIEEHFTESLEGLKSLQYLTAVEQSIRRCLFPYVPTFPKNTDGPTLRHFFHYLLATEEGFNYFNARRAYIDEAVAGIRNLCRILNIVDGVGDGYVDDHSTETRARNVSSASSDSPVERAITPRDLKEWPPWKSSESVFDDGSAKSPFPPDLSTQDDEYLLKRLKQYIWMVGEIASANYGIQILEPMYSSNLHSEHIAETLSVIFEKASHWQLRGLAFFQLGKMAGTVEGVEILDDLSWISLDAREKFNIPLAYPKFMQEEGFTKVEVLNPYKDVSYYSLFGNDEDIHVNELIDLEDDIVIESYEEIDEKILTLFNYLSSVLGRIERKATKELTRIKAESPQVFGNLNLFLKTIRLIDKGKFKYRTRVFIFELFHTMKIMEALVKKDRKSSSVKRAT